MRWGALLVTAALAFTPLAARGGEGPGAVPAKARALADRGRALHDAGEYAEAIAAFTQAYVIAPSPALLFNLAQAYRLQGSCDDAALMYRRYLATNPAPEHRALAELHLASVERCLHKLALHIPVDPAADHRVAPPPATLATTRTAATAPRRAQIERGVGIGLTLGGGASLVAAAYYAVQAREAADEVTAAYARGARWQDIAPADARGRSAATAARLLGAGGALGIAGGIVTYLIGRDGERPRVAVATTQHGLELGVRWAF